MIKYIPKFVVKFQSNGIFNNTRSSVLPAHLFHE
ncbi:uncharacterized protein METZ01_LOCUS422880 [marine metagenome]|uniref:Uncharacterized protein n=1 Tax=marine metagenome TaxID=408172 RepID=A0A382XFS2_9ZZZZ